MTIIIITSLTARAGKTMICAGLAVDWQNNGKKPAYLKIPQDTQTEDTDVSFMLKNLNHEENTVILAAGDSDEAVKKAVEDFTEKDMVIIESDYNTAVRLSGALNAKVVAVHDYVAPLPASLAEYKKLNSIAGVILNKVPVGKVDKYKETAAAELSNSEIDLLGIIPESRILSAMSVIDLAEALQGKILNNEDHADDLIENLMMGSSTFDRGAAYYGLKENKAVLLWGERPGFRKAAIANLLQGALQTSTRCIVISANGTPIPAVSTKAGELGVPLISAPGTMLEITSKLEIYAGQQKFNQPKKLPVLIDIMRNNVNYAKLPE